MLATVTGAEESAGRTIPPGNRPVAEMAGDAGPSANTWATLATWDVRPLTTDVPEGFTVCEEPSPHATCQVRRLYGPLRLS